MKNAEHPVDLDRFFADAKGEAPQMSMALMEGILGDAAEISAARQQGATATPPVAPRPRARLRRLLAPIGGWPGLAAVAACALLGVSAGYSGTDTLESLPGMGGFVSRISDDPLNDFAFGYSDAFDTFLAEG